MNSDHNHISEFSEILEKYLGLKKTNEIVHNLDSFFNQNNSSNKSDSFYSESFRIRSFIDRIITFTEKELSPKKHINLLLDVATITLKNGELFLTSDILSQVLFRLIEHKELLSEKAYAFMGLGEISSIQAKWGESFGYINKAKKIFNEISDTKGLAACDNCLGSYYAERGILSKARKHFESGVARLKGKRATNLLSNLLVNLGILDDMLGNLEESKKNYKKALNNYIKNDDKKRIAQTLHNLGMLYFKEEKYNRAIEQFDESILVSTEDNNFSTLAISFLGKAHIFAEQNKIKSADDFIDKAMQISHQVNDRLSIADIYKVRGIIDRKKKKFESSENLLQTSLRINSELGNKLNHAETSVELGILYLEMNQKTKAKISFENALKYYSRIKAGGEVKKIKSFL